MGNDCLKLISVGKLLGEKFFIPSYQRGYRWTEQEVKNLLFDIDEFDPKQDGEFYCLQPLVVKKDEAKKLAKDEKQNSVQWEVIDGQQRLTTIYILLTYLGQSKPYSIKYQTRDVNDNSSSFFLENIGNNEKRENKKNEKIDFFHMAQAYETIVAWFNGKSEEFKKTFKDTLLTQVQFIWYQRADGSNEYDAFKNLNSGKIPLTNAELIKALFLKNIDQNDTRREIQQNIIAEEFDQMERCLRQPDFWYFLNGRGEQPSSCIGLLFDLICNKNTQNNGYETYFFFNQEINYEDGKRKPNQDAFTNAKEKWKDVQKHFHILEGWFADPEIYNLIGFLRASGTSIFDVYDIFNESKNKEIFKAKLKSQSKKNVLGENRNFADIIKDDFRYDRNKNDVLKLLLLFNIASLNSINSNGGKDKQQAIAKFDFASFHQCEWNVEHISPNNAAYDNNKSPYPFEMSQGEKFKEKLSEENLKKIDPFIAVMEDTIMTLPNLTLLSEHINKSISNHYFDTKRSEVLEKHSQGFFVPPCTMMVFTKGYTTELKSGYLNYWSADDRKEYFKKIKDILHTYFDSREVQNEL